MIPLLIPLGFLFVVAGLILRLRALGNARSKHARAYWALGALACLLCSYAVLLLTLLAADGLLGHPWEVSSRWPALARVWLESDEAALLLLLDVIATLLLALGASTAARWFGYVDEANVWHPPRRLRPPGAKRRTGLGQRRG
ncbi:MAG TPA: hypothetical protein VIG66_02810 [Noviherbaspirillum sp.]